MSKNKNFKIIFETIYLTLGFLGIIGSFGYFNRSFNNEFYLYFTNLSNYFCIGVMIHLFINTLKNKEETKSSNLISFCGLIMLLVTLLVYNFLLAKDHSLSDYFLSINNLLMHLILPIMYLVHWILFKERGKTTWSYPLLATVLPLIYVLFITIRAMVVYGKTTGVVFPYFFLNYVKLGVGGFILWIFVLVLIFVVIGYLLYLLDHKKYRFKTVE